MSIIGNIAKNTAKEYAELLCKGIAGIGLMGFSYVTYNAITGSRKLAKKGFLKFADGMDKLSSLPTAEERKAMKEEKEKEAKLERQKAIREDMLRRQKESVLNGGR